MHVRARTGMTKNAKPHVQYRYLTVVSPSELIKSFRRSFEEMFGAQH